MRRSEAVAESPDAFADEHDLVEDRRLRLSVLQESLAIEPLDTLAGHLRRADNIGERRLIAIRPVS